MRAADDERVHVLFASPDRERAPDVTNLVGPQRPRYEPRRRHELTHDVAAHLSISQCEQKLGLHRLRFDTWWGFMSGHACIEAPESAPLVLHVVGAHLEQQPEEQPKKARF